MIFPWQTLQWQQLLRSKQANRLSHALLLTGSAGIGKAQFADYFSRFLLCQKQQDYTFCNDCHACHLMIGRAHPNVLWIEPEKKGQAIKVDQIRDATSFLNQTALQGEYQIVIIHPANAMNLSAANALLKTLEEPPQASLLILVADTNGRLPATIESRCQRLHFALPEKEVALAWLNNQENILVTDTTLLLNLAQGAPLAALQIAQEDVLTLRQTLYKNLFALKQTATHSLQFCEAFKETEISVWMDLLLSWLIDLLRINTAKIPVNNHDYQAELTKIAAQIAPITLTNFMWQIIQLRKQTLHGINFNKQMLLENISLKWAALQ